MLFNSYEFIFAFLPCALILFALTGKKSFNLKVNSLVLMSLIFYAWWSPVYIFFIVGSILVNYYLAGLIHEGSAKKKRSILVFGVVLNLSFLGYFKYSNFFVDNLNFVFGLGIHLEKIVLPLAISFFTFQQIAFLVDSYRNIVGKIPLNEYALFVTFFPQLIAGPIVHHKEIIPQFKDADAFKLKYNNVAIGFTIFAIGLFKKVIMADGIAVYANPVFEAAGTGPVSIVDSWGGVLCYTFQLYFDFSGYSDMAIGLGHFFGIKLPLNFNSPYKSTNIIDFWRRWHMTLSRFLRDYLYFTLGGNRKGKVRRYTNLFITMLLGGLWHGAGWTFVIWGALHGTYLMINHAWRNITSGISVLSADRFHMKLIYGLITFLSVTIAWTFFRSENFETSNNLLAGMFGQSSLTLSSWYSKRLGPFSDLLANIGFTFVADPLISPRAIRWIFISALWVWLCPNTAEFMKNHDPVCDMNELQGRNRIFVWKPGYTYSLIVSAFFAMSLIYVVRKSEFLYFQF